MCLLFWPFKNSDNLGFLKTHHTGLGEEICFFSSQKTHIMFVIVSINYSWVSQLDHRIVMSSVFDGRWKFDQIMSNQNKVFWGVGKSQGSRFGLPCFTSGLKWSISGGLTSYFSFWFDFTPWLPAVQQPRGFSPSPDEPTPAQQFPFEVVFYHSRSFFPAQ